MSDAVNLSIAPDSTDDRQLQSQAQRPPERAFIGALAELVSLDQRHAPELFVAGSDPSIWRWLPFEGFRSIGDARAWIAAAREAASRGDEEAFAIIDRSSGRVVGSTRFMNIRSAERAVEIGWTWLSQPAQRTGVHLEAKALMLRHAFEDCGALRVEFFCDEHNGRARASLVRLGATYEGTLRFHRCSGDVRRNSAAYSITAPEWPQVRAGVQQRFLRASRVQQPWHPSILAARRPPRKPD
jgi:RimJ/RimL family protein N-acetyltransferase